MIRNMCLIIRCVILLKVIYSHFNYPCILIIRFARMYFCTMKIPRINEFSCNYEERYRIQKT